MAEVTREQLEQIKADYQRAANEFTGAAQAIENLIATLFMPPAMTMGELKDALNLQSVEVVRNESQDA